MITKAFEYAAQLRRTYPGTCIADGAARDTLLGKEIKDFDIFVPINRGSVTHVCIELANLISEAITSHHGAYDDYTRPEFLGVIHIPNLKIDLVLFDNKFGTTPEQIVSTFDNCLSRAWLDELGNVVTTEAFDYSVRERRIYTYRGIQTRVGHLLRIARKYPEYDWALDQ